MQNTINCSHNVFCPKDKVFARLQTYGTDCKTRICQHCGNQMLYLGRKYRPIKKSKLKKMSLKQTFDFLKEYFTKDYIDGYIKTVNYKVPEK